MKLLKKEFRLCTHPMALIMMSLCALILIPNYPYTVSFFYLTLGLFFSFLSTRENHDAAYTLSLPVSRKEMVRARIAFACCLEGADLLIALLFIILKRLMGGGENAAGMDANVALIGEGLILFGLFNFIFFPAWYKDISKVGKPFLLACAAVFFYIVLAVAATYALPFVRDTLDTGDPKHLGAKALFVFAALVWFVFATRLGETRSVRRFEELDLQL